MYQFSIGVILDSFRCDRETALQKAENLGADGIQAYATYGDLSPYNLNSKQRKELLKQVQWTSFLCALRRPGRRLRKQRAKPEADRTFQSDH